MSEDSTKDISEKYDTKPTIETVLELISALDAKVDRRFDALEKRFERIEIRLDKIESIALEARAIANETQLDLRRLREQLNITV